MAQGKTCPTTSDCLGAGTHPLLRYILGRVKSFSQKSGWGFIRLVETADGDIITQKDVFFHRADLAHVGTSELKPGSSVTCQVVNTGMCVCVCVSPCARFRVFGLFRKAVGLRRVLREVYSAICYIHRWVCSRSIKSGSFLTNKYVITGTFFTMFSQSERVFPHFRHAKNMLG